MPPGERRHGGDDEEHARLIDHMARMRQALGDAEGLHQGEQDSEIAGVLVQGLLAGGALLLQLLPRAGTSCSSAAR